MMRGFRRCAVSVGLGVSWLALAGCGSNGTPPHVSDAGVTGGRSSAEEASAGGAGGTAASSGGSVASSGGASALLDGAIDCTKNRSPGIAVNSGTMSFVLDGESVSGGGQILWDGALNHATLTLADGASLVLVFPGCSPAALTFPPPPATVSITYSTPHGAKWECSYLDPSLSGATCTIDVTKYGAASDSAVTGTFSGTLVLAAGAADSGVRVVSDGVFFMQRP
jgi:hypothetical protein